VAQALVSPEESPTRDIHVSQEMILACLLVLEVGAFSVFGTNFATSANAFELVRLSVEIGLLTLALTPVLVTGGIDLSVGSLMGLSAVVFGMLWRDAHLPIWLAAFATLFVGLAAGSLNAFLIAGLRLPPLIVTLGTYSLYRGAAEALTRGVDNFTGFPDSFLFLGQGYFLGSIPAQLPILVLAIIAFWLLLQRSVIGRGLYAIGLSPEGARHAGIPVERRLTQVYVLSSFTSSVAAIIYVAHLGQAKSDAGTGLELTAITAVVLGGTSIFGGRGAIQGSVLGLAAIAVLHNGLRLAALPAELAGILIGGVLLTTMSLQRLSSRAAAPKSHVEGELNLRNSQVAVLCAVILAAALIVASSNWFLVRALLPQSGGAASHRLTIAMMPKSKSNAYFIACRKGAEEAARELNVDLIWDGPTDPDPAKQNEIIDTWITRGVDVIAVAVENREGISSVLRKARQRGIKVITWDADAETDARDFFVNQATPQGIGDTLMDEAGKVLGGKGSFAIISGSLTASNMIEWQKCIEKRRQEKFPDIKMAVLRPCDDLQKKAFDEAQTIMNAHPEVKLFMAICTPAVPGSAEAVKQSGHHDVKVIGLGLPNVNKPYVHEGITEAVILWNTMDLGYLAVLAAKDLHAGKLQPGQKFLQAGRLGKIEIEGDNILLGKPAVFTKANIDQFDF
jgi:rhamnose transport system substrate-binding protein